MTADDLDGAFRIIVWIISELGSIVKREESVRTRLEAIGLHIGGNVAERFVTVFVVFVFELYELIRVFLGMFVCGIGYVGTVRGLGIRLML